MKRRDFIKYFLVVSAAGAVAGAVRLYDRGRWRLVAMADKIKKYPGRIKPLGDEISRPGKWLG